MYDTEVTSITSDQRRAAKAINFGIIYGMGAFRLSQEIGISNKEAKGFIEAYFERYPGIKRYMEETKTFCRENGYVETLFGRRRYIPDIKSRNHLARTGAERVAINTRIQGSAADLIKVAMIKIDQALREENLNTKMLLQVHDELVFEVPKQEQKRISELVKTTMEHAATFDVPLEVDLGSGKNWREAH